MTDTNEESHTESDPEEPQQPEIPEKRIRISLFFDGTLNNRSNTRERESNSAVYRNNQDDDNSYENDLSNVAIMEEYVDEADGYDYSYSSYIEGVGTENLEGDSSKGAGLGTGDTGVKAKVDQGLRDVVNTIRDDENIIPSDVAITLLSIDVFGFSRGAACARHFIHKAMNTKRRRRQRGPNRIRPLKKRLEMLGFNRVDKVEICFVGLYDTVASYGIRHSNDTRELNLDSIGVFEAKKVIQLASADEHRSNFILTTIESAGTGIGQQVFLPGVHSDIGGGYRDDSDERLLLNKSLVKKILEQDKQYLIQQGWYQEGEIEVETPPEYEHMMVPAYGLGYGYMPPPEYKLFGTRAGITNGYSRVPLNIMAGFAKESGIKLRGDFDSDAEITSSFLNSVFNDLDSYAKQSGSEVDHWERNKYGWLQELRNKHCHFSAHYGKNIYGVYASNQPNIESGKRIRATNSG